MLFNSASPFSCAEFLSILSNQFSLYSMGSIGDELGVGVLGLGGVGVLGCVGMGVDEVAVVGTCFRVYLPLVLRGY